MGKVLVSDINDIDPDEIAAAVSTYLTANPVSSGINYVQEVPLSTWTITHSLGRVPSVSVLIDDEEVDADVEATETTVIIMFPNSTAGIAVLT